MVSERDLYKKALSEVVDGRAQMLGGAVLMEPPGGFTPDQLKQREAASRSM